MQSFLIIARDKNKASAHISNFLKEGEINLLDVNSQAFEKAMGIEDVRNIQKSILLKPFRGKTKAVVIEAYQDITIEAQNALLKVLEEPPANTLIIISISKKEFLLPTILSRCKIINLNKTFQVDKEAFTKYLTALKTLSEAGTGERLKIAQDIAGDKDGATEFIKNLIIAGRAKLLENPAEENSLVLLKSLQKTYAIIKTTNVSKRVALETLFLSF